MSGYTLRKVLFAAGIFLAWKITAATSTCPATKGKSYAKQDLSLTNFASYAAGSLVGADFQGAALAGAIFNGQDLTGASFCNANLGYATSGGATLPASFSNATLTGTSFIGAALNGTKFTYAKIACADFSNTSLVQADFGPVQIINAGSPTGCLTSFKGATLDVHAIAPSHWALVDFSNANFLNLSAATFSLAGTDITGAHLAGTSFSGIDFTAANLTNVDLSGASLVDATFDKAAMNGARLVNADLTGASLQCTQFHAPLPASSSCTGFPASSDPQATADFTGATLTNANLQNATLDGAQFNQAVLNGTNLSGASLSNARLQGVSIVNSDLTSASFTPGASLNGVQLTNLTMAGADFSGLTLVGTSFNGSVMPGAKFPDTTLQSVSFRDAVLVKAAFSGKTTTGYAPAGTTAVDFTCAQLGGADFTSADVSHATFLGAVMPVSPCCDGGLNCGSDAGVTYGTVILPATVPLRCPDGSAGPCTGTNGWSIPNWTESACSGTSTVVWGPPICNASSGSFVSFKDQSFKNCVLALLPGHPSDVSKDTAAAITGLNCPGMNITDLTGLENFTGLTSLDLTSNGVTQFAFTLPKLQTLNLSDNQLQALDLNLANHGNAPLVLLNASHNRLTAIQGVAFVPYLTVMDLSQNKLASFDLTTMTSLVYADLSANQLTTVLGGSAGGAGGSLSKLGILAYLDVSANALQTIGDVSSVANSTSNPNGVLQSLFVGCNASFACRTLGVDVGNAVMQSSQCAEFNSQSNQWVARSNPACATAPPP